MRSSAGSGNNAVRLPLLLTAAIHLGALLLALAAPRLMPEQIRIPEAYQVELYSAPEWQAETPAAPPPGPAAIAAPGPTAAPQPPTVPRLEGKGKVPTKTEVAPPAGAAAPPKAVSLAPIKGQLLKENRERQLNERVKALRQEHEQRLTEEAARQAALAAVSSIAEFYHAATPTGQTTSQANQASGPSPATAGTRSGNVTVAAARPGGTGVAPEGPWLAYKARLTSHIGRQWKLPVLQDWDPRLNATVILRIKRDGTVTSTWFERHSNNPRFDQYVKKAVTQASPLPPLPPESTQKSEEIAVTFTPGGLK